MVSVLSERRLNRLLNPALSAGLPAFLTEGAGMFSGHMLSQYTAGMLIVEQRTLSMPACVQSIPAAADQEDFVSMGMNTALKTKQILENAHGVLGIELIAGAQALDFRDYRPGNGTRAAHAAVRKVVEHLGEDRPLFPTTTTWLTRCVSAGSWMRWKRRLERWELPGKPGGSMFARSAASSALNAGSSSG